VRTANAGSFSSFQGVITGRLGTPAPSAASATFALRRQRAAAPNTSPRVGRRAPQQGAATVGGSPHALETRPFPHAGPSKRRVRAPWRSQLGPGSAGGQPAGRWSSAVRGGRFEAGPVAGGQSKQRGRGLWRSRVGQGSTSHTCDAAEALAPCWPQFGR
jgi:hypothetical protein